MFIPKYSISPEVLSAISEISRIQVIVERSRVLPLNELQLKREAMIRMVHTSTSIEGNPLEEYQVDKVLSGMSIAADDKSIIEVKNYQGALKEVEKLADAGKKLDEKIILNLHEIAMKGLLPGEKIGKYRPGPIYIVDDLGNGKEKLRYEGPQAKDLTRLVKELLDWLQKVDKDQIHPLLKAGIFHTQFVHIHPFSDGNGRVTRLLTNLLLYRDKWDFRKVIVLEEFYNKNRQDYYNALAYGWDSKFHTGADLTDWIEYFMAGFLVEARKVAQKISSIGLNKTHDKASTIYLDPVEVKIMDYLATSQQLRSDDVMKLLKVSKRTSQLKLKGLVDKKLIKPKEKGPATYYVLTEV
ncbi:Fic family protein [Candidatus Daviesbacteria bacterium]|nr:Fic family protein [Candidatus Daviesbacteria bacterium]